jgi:hypothetical protein
MIVCIGHRQVNLILYLEKFEGYFQFPRPLSKPFFNETMPRHQDSNEFINSLRETLKIKENIEQFDKKTNQDIPYFTSSLSLLDSTSKMKVIKSIDDYIAKFKEKNKYKLDVVKKDPKIKALKRAKKTLLANDGDKLIHGRTIPKPSKKVLQRIYDINNKNKVKKKKSADPTDRTFRNEKDDLSFSKFYLFTSFL